MEDIIKILGKRIRSYRIQLGYSQERLAEKSSCHPTYIGQIERGEKNPTIESIEKIAKALGISLSQLFEKIDTENQSDKAIPAQSYELILSKSRSEQESIYRILLELDRYKKE
ncbi:helix-turn-helix domain-containing protein [Acetobacterium malicum]|uniref:Helix-turn-helix domain-containing protein n=1 Tax=Acetobacterium malicum TaxID=52692 RepID=A0ABR6YU58_9FIRM|nr:helix-turn-helix transcriptional regulator [Acetobacterium malicum]MBC3898719.1 helix-turn-helix domain-containing protein [Acetobacterium malicum]